MATVMLLSERVLHLYVVTENRFQLWYKDCTRGKEKIKHETLNKHLSVVPFCLFSPQSTS